MDSSSTNTDQEPWNTFQVSAISLTPAQKNMIAGGIAGCIGKTLTAPLSRLTVLSQVSSLFPKDHPHHALNIGPKINIYGTLRSIVKQQGVLSLWNGNWTSVLHRFPYSAINFAVFEASNNYLSKITRSHDSPTNRFVAGALSGAAACFVCYPLDLVRTRLTVANSFSTQPEVAAKGSKIYHLVKDIILREGLSGLYRGLPVSLFVTAPTLAISFSIYGFVKGKLMAVGGIFTYTKEEHVSGTPLGQTQAVQHLTPLGSLCSGCLSGIASSCAIFPVDVVRKRMQVMGQLLPLNTTTAAVAAEVSGAVHSAEAALKLAVPGVSAQASTLKIAAAQAASKAADAVAQPVLDSGATTLQQAKHIFRTEGVRGFYRGIAPELLKVCPMVAIMYCSYEIVQDALNLHFPTE